MEFKKVCKDNTMRENIIPSSKMKVLKKINQWTKKTTLSSHLTRPCASECAPMLPRRMVVPEGKTFLPREPKTHGFGKNCLFACFQARLMKKILVTHTTRNLPICTWCSIFTYIKSKYLYIISSGTSVISWTVRHQLSF